MPIPILILIAIMVAAVVLGDLLRPKPKLDSAKPGQFKDFDFPTATENRPVQWFCGTVKDDSPNLIWSGDFHAEPIYQKIRTGLFSTQTIVRFYHYYVGMDLGLGFGPNVVLEALFAGDLIAWQGSVTGGGSINVGTTAGELFGGDSKEGGWSFILDFYDGHPDQLANPYMETILGDVPGYRHKSHAVIRGWSDGVAGRGYVGTSTNMKKIAFRKKRIIDVLGQTAYTVINDKEANPVDAIYELLTDYRTSLGLPSIDLNLASFQAAQIVCFNEGWGFNTEFDNQRAVGEFITEILSYINGVLIKNFQTGEFQLKLVRGDYTIGTLDTYDENHISKIQDYQANAYEDTTNEVKIPFTYIDDNFSSKHGIAQDLANVRTQNGAVISSTINYIGIGNPITASKRAMLDLQQRTTPLVRCTALFDATVFHKTIGDVFKLNWNKDGLNQEDVKISGKVMRIAAINYAELRDGHIPVQLIEDIFSIAPKQLFSPPIVTGGFTAGNAPAVQIDTADVVVMEQPRIQTGDDDGQLWITAKRPNVQQLTYDVYVDSGEGYQLRASDNSYTPVAKLNAPIARLTADVIASVALTVLEGIDKLEDHIVSEITSGQNLFRIGREIFAYETKTLVGNLLTLTNVWRALIDTTYEAHATDDKAWFFSYGTALLEEAYAAGVSLNTKILPRSANALASIAGATAINTVIAQRARRPIAPANLEINGSLLEADSAVGADSTLNWNHRNRLQLNRIFKQSDASFGPEIGTTYGLKIYGETGTLIHTEVSIDDDTFIYSNAQEIIDAGSEQDWLTYVLYGVREGLTSYMAQIRQVKRVGVVSAAPALPVYTPSGAFVPAPSLAGRYDCPTAIVLNPDGTVAAVETGGDCAIAFTEGVLDRLEVDDETFELTIDDETMNVVLEDL